MPLWLVTLGDFRTGLGLGFRLELGLRCESALAPWIAPHALSPRGSVFLHDIKRRLISSTNFLATVCS